MKTFEKLFDIFDQACEKELKSKLFKTSLDHLTFSHYEYLYKIENMGQPTLSELADNLGISKPSVTVMVNKLIKEDLVEKVQSDSDKRVFHVQLSKLGSDLVGLEKKAFISITKDLLNNLNDQEQKTLKDLLEKSMM